MDTKLEALRSLYFRSMIYNMVSMMTIASRSTRLSYNSRKIMEGHEPVTLQSKSEKTIPKRVMFALAGIQPMLRIGRFTTVTKQTC